MTTPARKFLAQLITASAADVRRSAVPPEAFEGGERDIYRAVRQVAAGAEVVTMEAIIAELREAGRLEAAGGYDAVDSLTDVLAMTSLDAARVELVAHASARALMSASKAAHEAARDGRSRDAVEAMQAALRFTTGLQGGNATVTLKSVRTHVMDYVSTAANHKPVPKLHVGGLSGALDTLHPGSMTLIYGFSQAGKSYLMQYLENAFARAGYPTLRVSCEDPDKVNSARLTSEVCDMNASRPHDLRKEDWARILAGTADLDASYDRRYVVEHSTSAEAIAQTIRAAANAVGIKVAFVDYAQILRCASARATDTQETRITDTTTLLKETCKELGVHLCLGSQVTVRDPKPGKTYKPTPFDLKGARSLYESSEQAFALWVDTTSGERFCEVQKDKINGRVGDLMRVESGRGGVFRALHAIQPKQAAPAEGYGYQDV